MRTQSNKQAGKAGFPWGRGIRRPTCIKPGMRATPDTHSNTKHVQIYTLTPTDTILKDYTVNNTDEGTTSEDVPEQKAFVGSQVPSLILLTDVWNSIGFEVHAGWKAGFGYSVQTPWSDWSSHWPCLVLHPIRTDTIHQILQLYHTLLTSVKFYITFLALQHAMCWLAWCRSSTVLLCLMSHKSFPFDI